MYEIFGNDADGIAGDMSLASAPTNSNRRRRPVTNEIYSLMASHFILIKIFVPGTHFPTMPNAKE